MTLVIHTDGAARGNPGEGGIGATIEYGNEKRRYKSYIGRTTNNKAEYSALLFALEKARELILEQSLEIERIVCYSDSELLVRQLTGKYKVKNGQLAQLFVKVWNVSQSLPKLRYKHVPRTQNKEADKLANEAIDEAKVYAPIV